MPSHNPFHVHYRPPPHPTPPTWHLTLTPPSHPSLYSVPPNPTRTSFGLLFTTPLPTSYSSLHLQPVHKTLPPDVPRLLLFPTKSNHVFLQHSDPTIYESPTDILHPALKVPRFLPVLCGMGNLPFLKLRATGREWDVFPEGRVYRQKGIDALYLVDQAGLKRPSNVFVTAENAHHIVAMLMDLGKHISVRIPVGGDVAYHIMEGGELENCHVPDVRGMLVEQAKWGGRDMGIVDALVPRGILPVGVGVVRREEVRVYCVWFCGGQVEVKGWKEGKREKEELGVSGIGDGVFIVRINGECAVELQMRGKGGQLLGGGKWERGMDWEVCCLQGWERLLRVTELDLAVWYWRWGEFEDWHEWELHLWSEGGEDARSFMVKGERPLRKGVVRFDLACCVFPKGVTVRAEMVRIETVGREGLEEGVLDATRRDVVREWKSGEVEGDLHFVQGEKEVKIIAPRVRELEKGRWIRVRYRRFVTGDYEDWDLWTWDEGDPECNRVACKKIEGSGSRSWVEFEIDRAKYGGGGKICMVPRKGGDEWLERDEPIRVWSSDLLEIMEDGEVGQGLEGDVAGHKRNIGVASELQAYMTDEGGKNLEENSHLSTPTYLIAQGTGVVFRRLEEAKNMLKAYVDSEHTVIVKSPVPVSWISPPRKGKEQVVSETELKLCGEAAVTLLKSDECHVDTLRGQLLRFRKIKEKSPTEWKLVFDEAVAIFHEDFKVENVIVSVPGFDSVPLTWKVHEDWDKNLYKGALGWEYEKDKCSFRCFAPTADMVYVVLYNSSTSKAGRRMISMRRIPEGCWKAIVHEDLQGKYYKLLAEGENKRLFPGVEIIDPYSRCNTGHTGRGLVFGTEDTDIFPRPNISPEDMIVYEVHVRDVTIDKTSGVSNRGKFLGLSERGTIIKSVKDTNSGGTAESELLTDWRQEEMPGAYPGMETLSKSSSGLDHIVQMGANSIQLLPIQDFDNDERDNEGYKWGYMPVHFNSPDGWYASSTTSVARVTEFKQLVDAIHRAGLKVIMDVVYNHTAEDSNEFNLGARFSFNGIAPRYYYRTCGNTPIAHSGDSTCATRKPYEPRCGECYSNGSGCGNEFRSESPMGRKFVIDSLKYWATEYKIDGFRFDLLGLIDVDTLEQASLELRNIDPNIVMYGEPWAGGISPIRITEKGMQRSKGFGVFNNTFRDGIRGSPFGAEETFVMDGGRHYEVKGGIIGSVDAFCDKPMETINYVECHDNYTLWDHMRFYVRSRTDDIVFSEDDLRRMHRLAAVIVFTSQGVPFIQGGQEMCRTKFDVENSYESPDSINMIRWKTKDKEWPTVQYYRGLILLRRSHPEIFCKRTADQVRQSIIFFEDLGLTVPERCIAYHVLGDSVNLYRRLQREKPNAEDDSLLEESQKWVEIVVLLNPTPSDQTFSLPGQGIDSIWVEVLNATHAGVRNLRCPIIGYIVVQGRSACVLRRASAKEEIDFQLVQRLASITDSYASFHGDDPLTGYAVGLRSEMNADEIEQQANLVASRKEFEKNRVRREDSNLYVPSSGMTEERAKSALDMAHGKRKQPTAAPAAPPGPPYEQ